MFLYYHQLQSDLKLLTKTQMKTETLKVDTDRVLTETDLGGDAPTHGRTNALTQ